MDTEEAQRQLLIVEDDEAFARTLARSFERRGYSVLQAASLADVERIREGVETRLAPIGHKVNAVVNYDRFSIVPELVDDYIAMVKDIMERHYHDVTRYTANTFLRMKLGEAMEKHQIPPRLYENADEAQGSLGKA